MLRLARALGFLAPLAVAGTAVTVSGLLGMAEPGQRDLFLVFMALAALAGTTSMALAAWSYMGWRLNRLARSLEETLDSDVPVLIRESGVPAERRLARAFNAASGAFLQVEARATHDRLTGVANRETLLTTLGAEVERAARHHKPLAVAFIDIDRFKPINDTYGHNSGDAVLRQVASLVGDNVRAVRPLRPLRRRGVHAHPPRDDGRRRAHPGREAALDRHVGTDADREQPDDGDHASAPASPAASVATSRLDRAGATRRTRPCTRRSRSAATAPTCSATSTTSRRSVAHRSPPSGARRRRRSGGGRATPPPRRWHRSSRRSRTIAAGRRT